MPELIPDAAPATAADISVPLRSDVLAFLTAIRDALTVPRPALAGDFTETMERRRRREELLADRATSVRIAAHVAVDNVTSGRPVSFDVLTETIRDGIDHTPVTYEVRQDPESGAPRGVPDAEAEAEGETESRYRAGQLAEQRHQLLDPAVPPPAYAAAQVGVSL